MAGPKVVGFRGIQDCKIAKITEDTASALTYDSLIDIPIKNLSFKPLVETFILKHDDDEQAIDQKQQGYEITGGMGRMSLDALAVMMGGTVAASGSGDAEIQTLTENATDIPLYFKLETQTTRVDGTDGIPGDIHHLFKKCKIIDMNYTIEDDWAVVEFTARAVKTINDSIIKTTVINETTTAIS